MVILVLIIFFGYVLNEDKSPTNCKAGLYIFIVLIAGVIPFYGEGNALGILINMQDN